MALLEVACFSPEHALLAYEAGADRIELCDNRAAGGTTPPVTWLTAIKQTITVPVFVMIRPRGGDFHYSWQEFSRMADEISRFKGLADGYVFGVLDGKHKVDVARTAELVERARPWPCTFHRAFDETPDASEALEDVIAAGCGAVLTSGGTLSALAGVDNVAQLVRLSRGRVAVIPGGGVRAKNIAMIKGHTGAAILHSSGVPKGSDLPSADEINAMKKLLQDPMVTLEPLQLSPSPDADGSVDDGGTSERMQMSAVSIGPSSPF